MVRKPKLGRHLYWRGKTIYGWFFDTARNVVKRSTETGDPVLAAQRLAQWERDEADPSSARRRDATLGGAFDLLVADRKALIAQGKRSEDSLPFYEYHSRAWLLFAGRLIDRVPLSQLDKSFDQEKKDALVARGKLAALATVDRHFTDEFIAHRRRQKISENTIAKQRILLRAALFLAKRAGIWTGDLDDLFPPNFDSGYEPKRIFWTHAQAEAVLEAIDLPHRRAQVAFVLATGAEHRAVERALRADLDLKPIPLRGTKTKDRERSCPVLFPWQKKLLKYAAEHADGKEGLAFTPWGNSVRDLRLACTAAKAPTLSLHGLRHVFGAWALDEGLSEGIVAKILGHRDSRQLEKTYDTRDPEAIQRRAEGQLRMARRGVRNR